PLDPPRSEPPDFPIVLPHRSAGRAARRLPPPRRPDAAVLRPVREQRSERPHDGDRELQHEPRRVLADRRRRLLSDRSLEQRLQARNQLRRLRTYALSWSEVASQ